MEKSPKKAQVARITVGRLFNLGNYEHIKYEILVDVPPGTSAETALVGVENIMDGLKPESRCAVYSADALSREKKETDMLISDFLKLGEDGFRKQHGHYEGTAIEYIARCQKAHQENVEKRKAWDAKAAKARELLDDLGGAAQLKDAKLDWESNDY